jgi:hypothetical protein
MGGGWERVDEFDEVEGSSQVKVGVFVRDKQAVKEAGAIKPTPQAHQHERHKNLRVLSRLWKLHSSINLDFANVVDTTTEFRHGDGSYESSSRED